MSHLACGDKPKCKMTKNQINTFKTSIKVFKENNIKPKWIHIAASSAFLRQNKYSNLGDMARLGLALYGFDLGRTNTSLKPVLKLITQLVQIKRIKKGETVGYDGIYQTATDATIGVLPLGYNDGIKRRLSNKGYVSIKNIQCKIIGRVSMNITTIDISHINSLFIGQETVIFSDSANDVNSIYYAAKICGTIPYDLMITLNPKIYRIII